MNNTSTCKKCGAPIVWLNTPKGKKMPADAGLRAYKENPEGKNSVVNDWGEVIRCDLPARRRVQTEGRALWQIKSFPSALTAGS